MAEDSPGGGGIKGTFTRKLGPLPAWAWVLAGAGVGFLYLRYRASKATSSVGSTAAPSDLVYGAAPGSGGLLGSGLGAGGFVDSGSSGTVITPPVTTPPTGDPWYTVVLNGVSWTQTVSASLLQQLLASGYTLAGSTLTYNGPTNPTGQGVGGKSGGAGGGLPAGWYTIVLNGKQWTQSVSADLLKQLLASGYTLSGTTLTYNGQTTPTGQGTGSKTQAAVAGNLTPAAAGGVPWPRFPTP